MKFRQTMIVAGMMAVLLPMSSWAEDATVYQCKDKNGTVIFSGTPCGSDAKERVISAPNAGTGADTKGIKELANQYDQRQAQEREEAAKIAAARAAARAKAQADQPVPTDELDIIGYPLPGYYPGYYPRSGVSWWLKGRGDGWSAGVGSRHDHYRPPRSYPTPPPVPYVYKDPGISGQFPGGAPGSSGSNFQPVRP
ncbi:DUF4124 domain-containing protein [Halothiobacillus sp.]|uniref:DUF4124 domain-containing protein n=1 Tax=Halothiobacillus sp. TaxID=1891311 RepID=UPI003D1016B0